jgi:TonB family protein
MRNRDTVLSFEDYPEAALRKEESGLVSVLLHVSAEGRVSGCEVTESSGSAALDSGTCDIFRRRAHFDPARSPEGKPIEGAYRTHASWGIGGRGPETTLYMDVAVQALPRGYARPAVLWAAFDGSGRMFECAVDTSSGSAAADAVACRQAVQGLKIAPPRAPAHRPAAASRQVQARFVAAPR